MYSARRPRPIPSSQSPSPHEARKVWTRCVSLKPADRARAATIGGSTVSDQNQRRWTRAATGLIDAADCPAAAEDGVVRAVLVDPGAETSGGAL